MALSSAEICCIRLAKCQLSVCKLIKYSELTAFISRSVLDSVNFGVMKNWARRSRPSSKAGFEQSKWKFVLVKAVKALFIPPFLDMNSAYSFSDGYFSVP